MDDIRKIFRKRPIASIQTSLGIVYVYPLTLGDKEKLKKNLGKAIESCNSKEFVKNLFVFTCFPEESVLDEEKLKPENPVFTLEKISKLADPELEEIAKAYVVNNEWGFTKQRDEEGKEITYLESGEILQPQNSDENSIDYLFRLFSIFEEQEQKRYKKMIGMASLPDLFTDDLGKKIRETLDMGARLSESLEPFRAATVKGQNSIKPIQALPSIDFEEIHRSATEGRERPFKELGNKLDQVTATVAKVANFVVAANETQMQIVAEIKSSSNSANAAAENDIKLTKTVIIISVVSLLVAIISLIITVYMGVYSTTEESLSAIKEKAVSAESILLKYLENAASQTESLYKRLEVFSQSRTKTDELTALNNQQSKVITDLQKRIDDLENYLAKVASSSIKP